MDEELKCILKGIGAENIPLCYRCADRLEQEVFDEHEGVNYREFQLVGCRKLGERAWKSGWKRDKDGKDGKVSILWQHNCPLFSEKRVK